MMRVALPLALLLLSSAAWADANIPVAGVPNADQNAAPAGKGWSVSTGVVSVPANMQLDVVLANPAANTCTAVYTLRRYANPNNANLQFQSFVNPTAITTNPVTVGNRLIGASPASGLTFGYAARASGSMGGTAGVASTLFANTEEKTDVPIVVKPGTTQGVSITGMQGGVLAAAASLAVTFVGYCQ